jgi:hypothetical protein
MKYVIDYIYDNNLVSELVMLLSQIKVKVIDIPQDSIIISDSNDLFIDIILNANKVKSKFAKIFCNRVVKNKLIPYGKHNCLKCIDKPNMCKTLIIQSLGIPKEDKIIFVADGKNDFCPAVYLKSISPINMVFIRSKYKLDNMLSINDQYIRFDTYEYLQLLIEEVIQSSQ